MKRFELISFLFVLIFLPFPYISSFLNCTSTILILEAKEFPIKELLKKSEDLIKHHEFAKALEILNPLYLDRGKNPLYAEKISIYYFHATLYQYATNRNSIQFDQFKDLYTRFSNEFPYSRLKYEVKMLRILSEFLSGNYVVYLYMYNDIKNNIDTAFEKEVASFFAYCAAFSYYSLGNAMSAKEIISFELKRMNNPKKGNLIVLNGLIDYQLLGDALSLLEKKDKYLQQADSFPFILSVLEPLDYEKIMVMTESIKFIKYHVDDAVKKTAGYTVATYGRFILLGTFMDGLYVYDVDGRLVTVFLPVNSSLYSPLIRSMFVYENHVIICSYDGINSLDFSAFDEKVYMDQGYEDASNYFTEKVALKKIEAFPFGKKYSSVYENNKMLIASTHYNGVYVLNKKDKAAYTLYEGLTCEKIMLYEHFLIVATPFDGVFAYDMPAKKSYQWLAKHDIKDIEIAGETLYLVDYANGVYSVDVNALGKKKSEPMLLETTSHIKYIKNAVLFEDKLMLATLKTGLYSYDLKSEMIINYGKATGFFSDILTDVAVYQHYLVVVSLSEGFILLLQKFA